MDGYYRCDRAPIPTDFTDGAAAVLAMIPLSRSIFFGPMAVAIMGGLIVATFLTLFFLPNCMQHGLRLKKRQLCHNFLRIKGAK